MKCEHLLMLIKICQTQIDINRYSSALTSILILLIIILIVLLFLPEFFQTKLDSINIITFINILHIVFYSYHLCLSIFLKGLALLTFNITLFEIQACNHLKVPEINHTMPMRKTIFPFSSIN